MTRINKINFIFLSIITSLIIALLVLTVTYFKEINRSREIIEYLEVEVEQINKDNQEKERAVNGYEILTYNLNTMLSTIFYGSAVPSEGKGREKNFTAFSMYYNDNFYLITAGHCIEFDGINYTDFKFKSNSSNIWLYPELLYYENDYQNNRDFAIFYHRNLRSGLMVAKDNYEPKYVLGNTESKISLIKEFSAAEEGESGSPILNAECRLVGVVIKSNSEYTPIEIIIEKINELVNSQNN